MPFASRNILIAGRRIEFNLVSDFYVDTGAGAAQINYAVNSNGEVNVQGLNDGTLGNYDWVTPKPPVATYWVRVSNVVGVFDSGTTNTWLALSSNRSWSLTAAGGVDENVSFDIEIATDSGGTDIVASASVALSVFS